MHRLNRALEDAEFARWLRRARQLIKDSSVARGDADAFPERLGEACVQVGMPKRFLQLVPKPSTRGAER